jgi:hypothetical protein
MLRGGKDGARGDGQASFVEAFLRPDVGANRRLERIDRMIDWAPVAALVEPVRSGVRGRPSYPPSAMLKALLLQRWYSLSDEALEEALSDRLSFRRSAASLSMTKRRTPRPSAASGWRWWRPSCAHRRRSAHRSDPWRDPHRRRCRRQPRRRPVDPG